jgi:two-component system, OmpR family, KDP operon response regulator KdpE
VSGPTILLIEDEPQMRRFLRATLAAHDYRPLEAATAREGMALAGTDNPAVILLDLGLPDLDGLEVTRQLREWTSIPIIVISARGQEGDKIKALDAGADDYLTKPFGAGELMARIRVALRHGLSGGQMREESVYEQGALRVDLVQRRVLLEGQEVHLTPIEYKLLTLLVRHAGKVITHGQLLREVWGPAYAEQTHYLRVYMAQLRQKLEADPARPRLFQTEAGVGYRLRVD